MTIGELKELCLRYDNKKGTYPESGLEGLSLFSFYLGELNLSNEDIVKKTEEYQKEVKHETV
jgi:hypothetical protein